MQGSGLCWFCYHPLCLVSQQSWFAFCFLNFPILIPPPPSPSPIAPGMSSARSASKPYGRLLLYCGWWISFPLSHGDGMFLLCVWPWPYEPTGQLSTGFGALLMHNSYMGGRGNTGLEGQQDNNAHSDIDQYDRQSAFKIILPFFQFPPPSFLSSVKLYV